LAIFYTGKAWIFSGGAGTDWFRQKPCWFPAITCLQNHDLEGKVGHKTFHRRINFMKGRIGIRRNHDGAKPGLPGIGQILEIQYNRDPPEGFLG
jgi:hypothetical protein